MVTDVLVSLVLTALLVLGIALRVRQRGGIS